MRVETNSRAHAIQLLLAALEERGIKVATINGDALHCQVPEGRFSLTLMPGNRRTLISHDLFLEPSARGKGLGRKLLGLREEAARQAGITLLLATVRNDNSVEVHLLNTTSGWQRLTNCIPTQVSLWGKELHY